MSSMMLAASAASFHPGRSPMRGSAELLPELTRCPLAIGGAENIASVRNNGMIKALLHPAKASRISRSDFIVDLSECGR